MELELELGPGIKCPQPVTHEDLHLGQVDGLSDQ
jgi:hypothetical protein